MKRIGRQKRGFTIVELMIATTIFATVLLLTMVGITRMGRLYYKGISQAQTQEVMRLVADDVTTQIQFGKGVVEPSGGIPTVASRLGGESEIFCIGDLRYKITYNRALSSANPQVFIREPKAGTVCSYDELTDPFDTNVTELMSNNMRVSRFNLRSSGNGLWSLDMMFTTGTEDLLEYPTGPQANDEPVKYNFVKCKGLIDGAEFCATSELNTTVLRRYKD